MAIGALLPILITSVYFWALGIFKAMFDASITYNVIYSETNFNGASGLIAGLQNLGFAAWIGLIGYGIVLFLLIRQWRAKDKTVSDTDLFIDRLSVCGGGHRSGAKKLWTLFCQLAAIHCLVDRT